MVKKRAKLVFIPKLVKFTLYISEISFLDHFGKVFWGKSKLQLSSTSGEGK
jgi:hypothetical protein